MKRLHLIFLILVLLFSQGSSLDHIYHDHKNGEVCDYCLSAQPLDHAVTTSIQPFLSIKKPQWQAEPAKLFITKSNIRYYAVRAPPRFI